MPLQFSSKVLQIKYTIEEKVSLEEMVRQGEKIKGEEWYDKNGVKNRGVNGRFSWPNEGDNK